AACSSVLTLAYPTACGILSPSSVPCVHIITFCHECEQVRTNSPVQKGTVLYALPRFHGVRYGRGSPWGTVGRSRRSSLQAVILACKAFCCPVKGERRVGQVRGLLGSLAASWSHFFVHGTVRQRHATRTEGGEQTP